MSATTLREALARATAWIDDRATAPRDPDPHAECPYCMGELQHEARQEVAAARAALDTEERPDPYIATLEAEVVRLVREANERICDLTPRLKTPQLMTSKLAAAILSLERRPAPPAAATSEQDLKVGSCPGRHAEPAWAAAPPELREAAEAAREAIARHARADDMPGRNRILMDLNSALAAPPPDPPPEGDDAIRRRSAARWLAAAEVFRQELAALGLLGGAPEPEAGGTEEAP